MKLTMIQAQLISELYTTLGFPILIGFDEVVSTMDKYSARSFYIHANGGYYKSSEYEVEFLLLLPENTSDINYITNTIFHELAHATGDVLNRVKRSPNYFDFYQEIEECTAELTASKLMDYFELNTKNTQRLSKNYLEKWGMFLTVDQMKKVEAQANAAMLYILKNWLPDFNAKYQQKKVA